MFNRWKQHTLEFYTLSQASELAAPVEPKTKKEAEHNLTLSRQRANASAYLWHVGARAEALRLALEAFRETMMTLRRNFTTDEVRLDDTQLLISMGLRREHAARICKLEGTLGASELPVLERDVDSKHGKLHSDLLFAHRTIDARLTEVAAAPTSRVFLLLTRWAITLGILGMSIALIVWLIRPAHYIEATASSHTNSARRWGPQHLVDGYLATEWAADARPPLVIDLSLHPARDIRAIELVNGHNPPWNDRGTRDFRVETYSGGRRVSASTGRFDAQSTEFEVARVPMLATQITSIRVQILSWHGRGPALAEIRVVER